MYHTILFIVFVIVLIAIGRKPLISIRDKQARYIPPQNRSFHR